MKKAVLLILGFVMLGVVSTKACDVRFEVIGNKKACYHKGDIIKVKVEVFLTHRNCTIGIKRTQFVLDGLQVISATQWKQTGPKKYERIITMRVTDVSKGYVRIQGIRKCDKTGGFGELKLRCK